MANLLFILGRGRSGTTLLSKMLNNHEAVAVAPEGFFAYSLKARYQSVTWNNQTIRRFLADLQLENRMKTWNLDFEVLEKELQALSNSTFTGICKQVYEHYAHQIKKPNAAWVVDKNPHYALFPANILKTFTGSKAIFIYRDYRDNILSYQQVPFDTNLTHSLAYRWYYYNKQLLTASQHFHSRICWLSYEALSKNPESELNRLCQFLEIPFRETMLTFHESENPDFYGKNYAWFQETKKPVNTAHVEKWHKNMSVKAAQIADAICQPLAQRLGYEPAVAKRSAIGLKLAVWKGIFSGYLRVLSETLLFTFCPFKLRTFVINRYRSATGRT